MPKTAGLLVLLIRERTEMEVTPSNLDRQLR